MIKKNLYIFFLFFTICISAQQKKVVTAIDTTRNKIGAQFTVSFRTTVDTLSAVVFPESKTFGALEVIRSYPIDTIKKDALYELVKKYGLTQFDSGKYIIPRQTVLINKKPFFTDSIAVEVSNVKVDTLKQKLYDIKDIVHVDKGSGNWWKYLLGLLIVGIAGYLLYRYLKKRKASKNDSEIFKTPIEKATTLLQQLERKELWQKGEVKNYYSELTDIARNYIEEAIHIPAMESTTSELILALRNAAVKKNMSLTPETVENLERVLKQADLVKFAKSKPLEYEIADDRAKIEKAIVTLDQSIPEEIVDDSAAFLELQKQKFLRKQKRKKVIIAVASVFFLLLLTGIYFTATKGFDYLKDNIIGHPTKDLAEGEWIVSEYGNPPVGIETPKVLKRTEASKALSKDAMALLKDFQMFTYGSITDNFYIGVSTNTYQAETQVDLNAGLEGLINNLEMQGAQNLLVKQEEYETREGISGVKAYGTLTQLDKIRNEQKKMAYQILLFGQDNGMQQIMIMHEQDDNYAKEITDRILMSVELKKVQP